MSWTQKLHVTHRQMAIALTFFTLVPIILTLAKVPFTLPITIGSITKDFYNEIEKLPPGSIVAFANHNSYSGYLVKKDEYRAIFYHLFDKQCKLIMVSFWPDTPQVWTDLLAYSGVEKKYNIRSGTDFVVFPFLSGEETALAAIAADFHKAFTVDLYGNPIDSIPLMTNVHSLRDVQLTISDAGSFTFIDMFVRQWPAAYDVPSINIYVYSTVAPYYPRFVQGALDGSRGGAEYEVLTKYPGAELIKLNARNLQGLWVLVTIVIGNIAFFGARNKKILAEGQKT